MKKSRENLCDLWDSTKRTNIRVTGVPEGEREDGAESLYKETIAENFPDLVRILYIQVHEANRSSH